MPGPFDSPHLDDEGEPGGELVPLFHSPDHRACRERALVLRSKGVPFVLARNGRAFTLFVAPEASEFAREELRQYEVENAGWPPREELPPAAPGYVEGGIAYLLVLVGVFVLSYSNALGLDWYAAGRSDSAAVRSGELWRTVTALCLHSGILHLASNLVFGSLFGFLVAYVHGGGLGWLAILVSGILGNATNAWLQGPGHLSIGASTAVFGAVGLLVGSEWRRRQLLRHGALRRFAPFLAGVLLLGYLGMGEGQDDTRTDVVAHVTGLFWGVPLGALLASLPVEARGRRRLQLACGAAALALPVAAWIAAFA